MIEELLDELGFHFNETYMFKDEPWVLMPYEKWFVLVPLTKGDAIKVADAKNALRVLLKLTPARKRTYGEATCRELECHDCPFNVLDCDVLRDTDSSLNELWDAFKKENGSIDAMIEQHLKKEL